MEILNSIKKFNEKIAIVDNDGKRLTSYKELDELSNKLCAKLISDGIGEGSRIILKFDRCREFIISIFAVLKAKCAFISVLPEYPEERINYIKKDSGAFFILTIDYFNNIEEYSLPVNYDFSYDEKNSACILYTSGSTGVPKGILYDRKGLDALATRNFAVVDLEEINWGSVTPFSFVVIFYEVFIVLKLGATIHILSNEVRSNIKSIEDYYEKHKLTCGFMSPRVLTQYKNKDKYLKRIMAGGEKLSNFYTDEFEVINLYGQSEGLIISMFKVDKKYDSTPIGKPYPDAKVYLLDENGNEVKKGEEGEICVVGNYSIGYVNLEEKTNKTYEKINNNEIRIHTGDIGKYDDNGNLVYINRKDNMIKLHGQRIEPGEIEEVINELEGINGSVVKAFEKDDGTMVLVAFYTGKEKVDTNIIKEKISKKLPKYMLPKNYVYLEKFPLNNNGKIDRLSLKLPSIETFIKKYVKPTNDIEERLCTAFEKLFNIEKIGIDDNFYELGGNSLNATKLVSISNIDELTSQIVLEGETVRGIANILKDNTNKKPKILKNTIVKNEYRMSLSQIYQYEICKVTNQPLQNMAAPYYYKLPKNTNVNKLKNAIYKMVEDNKIYKINVDLDLEKIFINQNVFVISEKNIKENEFEKYRLDTFRKIRDYKKDYLFEAEIIVTDKNEKYLRLYIDHLLYDGISLNNLLNTISKNYKKNNEENTELTIFDAINYENSIEKTDFYKAAINYYDSIYVDIEESKLLKKESNKYTGGKQQEILSDISIENLNEFFKNNHISSLTFFMFALDLTIREYFDTENFTYMNIYNGRYDEKLMKAHGCFAKGVFLKSINLRESDKIQDLLKILQNNYQKITYYDILSFKYLLSRYKNIRSGIVFNYKEDFDSIFEIENEKLNVEFFSDLFKLVKLYVDMDISLTKTYDKYYMMINTIKLDNLEVLEFEKIYDKYCHRILECDNIKNIIL